MKLKYFFCAILLVTFTQARAFDIKDLLGGSNGDNNLGDLGNIIGGVVNQFIATTDIDPAQLAGEWTYSDPAVDFASDDLLKNAGGAAMATTIESKLAPYYKTAGLTNLKLTVDDQANFSMVVKIGTLSGTIEKGDSCLYFNFKAFKSVSIGKIAARAKLAGNQLDLTFDVSGLIKILKTVSSVAGSKAFGTVTSMLESYDGLFAGFTMTRQ